MLKPVDVASIEYLCFNLRECDRTEVFAMRPYDNPLRLAWDANHMILNTGRGVIAWHQGKPAGLAAFTSQWPGTWDAWMFGTNEFKSVALYLIRWLRREGNDILSVCGGHRLQCDCRVGHDEAHKMIQSLGAVPEVTLRKYGKDGSDFIRYVWLKGENDAVLRPHYKRAASCNTNAVARVSPACG
jgi:hypothetical protein